MNTLYFACAKYIYLGKNIWAKCQDSPTSYIWVKKKCGSYQGELAAAGWARILGHLLPDT